MRKLETPEPRYFSGLPAKVKTYKLQTIGILLVLTILVVSGVLLARSLNPSHRLERKLASLDKTTVTCEQILREVGGTTDYSRYTTETQIKLLRKQILCFSDQLKFNQAIASAEKLKKIYVHEKNATAEQTLETQIESMKNTKAVLDGYNK